MNLWTRAPVNRKPSRADKLNELDHLRGSEMHQRRYHILVMETDPVILLESVNALKKADYVVVGASTADDASWWLSGWPIDLVVAPAWFESASGVQTVLAARSSQPEVSGLITGAAGDVAIQSEAEQYGVHVASEPVASKRFVAEIATVMHGMTRRQRWPRKAVSSQVVMRVGTAAGKLMDVSYGGLKFELPDESSVLRSPVQLDFPRADLRVPVEVVWSTRPFGDRECVFGASIAAEPSRIADWRAFVDRLA